MRASRGIGAIALLLLTAAGFPARVGAEPERVRIQFSAPKRCPDETAFLRALRQRTGRFQLASGAEQTRMFAVTITQTESSVAGRLEIQGPGTGVSLRNVFGKTCDEVMAALALMTALAVDPDALSPSAPSPSSAAPTAPARAGPSTRTLKPPASEASPLPPPAQAAAPPASTTPTSSTAERGDVSPSRMGSAPAPALPAAALAQSATTPSSTSARWRWSAGAHGGLSSRISPTLGLGGSLFVEAAAPGTAVLGPVLRAGLFFDRSDVTLSSGAGAVFWWAAALGEGCPLRLTALDSRIGLYPCLAFHLGVLRGQGRNLDQPEQTTDLWADLGPVARIRVAVWEHLAVEAQGMLVFPLRHLTFDVQDEGAAAAPTTVFAVPLVGALAGIGVAYEFR
jgi:hypothetical protein